MVNKLLLLNILPLHVGNTFHKIRTELTKWLINYINILLVYDYFDAAEVYVDRTFDELYHEEYKFVACLFASIPNFMDYFTQQDSTEGGLHCLEFLNHIISGFDAVRYYFA